MRLVLVIQTVEFRDAGVRLRVVLAELLLRLPFFVPAFQELVPFLHIGG